MTSEERVVGSAPDWLRQISLTAPPIRSNTQIWVASHHYYEMFALVPQLAHLYGETSGGVVKCRLFSQATI